MTVKIPKSGQTTQLRTMAAEKTVSRTSCVELNSSSPFLPDLGSQVLSPPSITLAHRNSTMIFQHRYHGLLPTVLLTAAACREYTCVDYANCESLLEDGGTESPELQSSVASSRYGDTSVTDSNSEAVASKQVSDALPPTLTVPSDSSSESVSTRAQADTGSGGPADSSLPTALPSDTSGSTTSPCVTCTEQSDDTCGSTSDLPLLTGQHPPAGTYTGSIGAPMSRRPKLTWRPVSPRCGQIRYQVQLDDSCEAGSVLDCAFSTPEVDALTADPSFTPVSDLAVSDVAPVGTAYCWRVRACDGAGCGEWTQSRYLNVGRVLTDVNGDGFGDVVLEGRFGDVVHPADSLIFVAGRSSPSDPDVVREMDLSGERTSWEHARFVGDLNGDGFADLAFGRYDVYQTGEGSSDWPTTVPYVVYGSREWSSLKATAIPHLDADLTSQPYYAGDVDGDGLSDLLLGDSTRGSGTFRLVGGGTALSNVLTEGPFSYANGVGDISGDGLVDLVTCSDDGNVESTWLRSIQPAATIELGLGCAQPWSAGDFDGDHSDDLILIDADVVTLHLSPPLGAADWSWNSGRTGLRPVLLDSLGSISAKSLVFVGENAQVLTFSSPLPNAPDTAFSSPDIRGFAITSDLDGDGSPELVSGSSEGAYWTRTGSLFAASSPISHAPDFELSGVVTQ